LQYAVVHLKVKVVVVLGHEGCGAVKAAGLPMEKIQQEPKELARALQTLKAGLDEDRLCHVKDARAHDREAVVTNVRRQVEKLTKDKCIMSKVSSEELILVGAFYEISSGIVDFFLEVTESKAARKDSTDFSTCGTDGDATSPPGSPPRVAGRLAPLVQIPGLHRGVSSSLVVEPLSPVPPLPGPLDDIPTLEELAKTF
jgi:hypothetical protein